MDEGDRKIYKVKMYCAIGLTIFLAMITIVTLFNPYSYSSSAYPGGGKGGFLVVSLAALNSIFHPLLGDHAISGSFILLTLISCLITYYYYKKTKNEYSF